MNDNRVESRYCSAILLTLCIVAFGCSKAPQPSSENERSDARQDSVLGPLEGIYSIVDPVRGVKTYTDTRYRPLKEIIGDRLVGVDITLRRSGQVPAEFAFASASETTEKQVLELFRHSERKASSGPIWNIDWNVEIVGTLEYSNGIQGKFAIAGFKVGFQDQTGQPWYFEWEEKYPSRKAP